MERTIEVVLSIISIIINVVIIFVLALFLLAMVSVVNDPNYEEEIFNEYYHDPNYTLAEAESEAQLELLILKIFNVFLWIMIMAIIVAIVLTIIGMVKVNHSPKTGGVMFIIAFILSGILSPAALLLLGAGILSFSRNTGPIAAARIPR